MKTDTNYRPAHVEFDVTPDQSKMPESFGTFESAEEASKFMGEHLVSINSGITVNRHMDNYEKKKIRERYQDVLENEIPSASLKVDDKNSEFIKAKELLARAKELVSGLEVEVMELAKQVKVGLVEMKLDEVYTFKVPYKKRFYIYTYIDKQIRLVAMRDMTADDEAELFSSSQSNEEFIENHLTNGKIEPQEGKKE